MAYGLQVLPVSEESRSDGMDDLVKLEDVRVEVMRSRGAGGQVRLQKFLLRSSKNRAERV